MIKQQELAKILSKKHNIELTQVDSFLNSFVSIILETLENGENVKIKGLGTFRIIKVKDRESVKVITGERYIIYGHDKIGFTPDNAMKDIVNRPFSQFETVILNEGVEFDDIEEKEISADRIDEDEFDDVEASDVSESDDVSDIGLNVNNVENVASTDNNIVINDTPEDKEIDRKEYIDKEDDEKTSVKTDNEIIAHDDLNEFTENHDVNKNKLNVASKAVELPVNADEKEEMNTATNTFSQNNDYPNDNDDSNKFSLKNILTWSVFSLAIGLIGGYFIGHHIVPPSPAVVYVEQNIDSLFISDTIKAAKEATKKEAEQANIATKKEDKKNEVKEDSKQESKPTSDNISKKGTDANISQEQYEAKYPAVRFGAYRIEGVAETVKVKKGQTLKSISKAFLGPDMECYVIALNDGKTQVAEGDLLKIPKLKLKKNFKK